MHVNCILHVHVALFIGLCICVTALLSYIQQHGILIQHNNIRYVICIDIRHMSASSIRMKLYTIVFGILVAYTHIVQCQIFNNILQDQSHHPLTSLPTPLITHVTNNKHNQLLSIVYDHIDNEPHSYMIHMKSISNNQLQQCISNTNYIQAHYIPYNTYLIIPLNNTANTQLLIQQCTMQPYIDHIMPYTAEHKYHQHLIHDIQKRLQSDPSVQLNILIYRILIQHNRNLLIHTMNQLHHMVAPLGNTVALQQSTDHTIIATIPAALSHSIHYILTILANLTSIEYIELKSIFHTQNIHAVTQVQSGYSTGLYNDAVLYQNNLTGANQLISVGDTGLAYNMCYFRDTQYDVPINTINYKHRKIVAYFPTHNAMYDLADGHGTHTANSIAGSIELDDISTSVESILSHYDGVAYNSKLVVFNLNDGMSDTHIKPPHDIYNDFYMKSLLIGSYITSNSWGSHTDQYIRESRDTDLFTYNNPWYLPIFAAGNYGSNGWNTIVAPSNSKNVLSVGATRNYPYSEYSDTIHSVCTPHINTQIDIESLSHQLSPMTSKGPTFDLRIKPELVVPGDRIVSARSSGNISDTQCKSCDSSLMVDSGTSMACAILAGTAALIRQYYMDGFYPTGSANTSHHITPTNSLMRATLIHSTINDIVSLDPDEAQYMSTSIVDNTKVNLYRKYQPNNLSGWGRVVLSNVLQFDHSRHNLIVYDSVAVYNNHYDTYCINITGNNHNIRSTLVWTDPAASLSSTHLLINNLDLLMINVDSMELYYGNHWLDHNDTPYTDITNNIEQITIDQQLYTTGEIFSIHVKGSHIPIEPQPYSLVLTGDIELIDSSYCHIVSCPNQCSNNGVCNNDNSCTCNAGYTGVDCGMSSTQLTLCSDTQHNLTNSNWNYYSIAVNNIDHYSNSHTKLRVAVTSMAGDTMLYTSYTTLPTLSTYGNVTHNKDNVQIIDMIISNQTQWYIGVYSHCCTDSTYNIDISLVSNDINLCIGTPATSFSTNSIVSSNDMIVSLNS